MLHILIFICENKRECRCKDIEIFYIKSLQRERETTTYLITPLYAPDDGKLVIVCRWDLSIGCARDIVIKHKKTVKNLLSKQAFILKANILNS